MDNFHKWLDEFVGLACDSVANADNFPDEGPAGTLKEREARLYTARYIRGQYLNHLSIEGKLS